VNEWLVASVILLIALAIWDLFRRALVQRVLWKSALLKVVEDLQAHDVRNEAAFTNFLTKIYEVVKFTHDAKVEAERKHIQSAFKQK